ncbi:MAG: SprT-like domain-containing protein [Bacteroidales bacterium]|nr:SprT-like domain-containing protein [Bacteroidales bacterium]
MIPAVPYIESRFDEFNALMFGGSLPKVPIVLGRAASYVGQCTFKTRRRLLRKREYYDFKLRFSTRFDLPEPELEDTVIHEMIHYYIKLNGISDTSAHGKVFRQMMNDINSKFGRHITISHRSTQEQREALIDKRPRVHVVAIVSFRDGRQGLKLLPRIAQRITAYHRVVGGNPGVAGIEYYIEDDPWFNRFPTSSAYNVFFPSMEEVREHISGKVTLKVTRSKVEIID